MKKIILLFSLFVGFTSFLTAQTIDPNFNVTLGGSNYIKQVIPQSDGKILICGQITSVNGVERIGIARLNEDGSLDNSFQPNLPLGTVVDRMLLKMDGNILVAGNFVKMKQLGSDGLAQTSFNFGDIPGYGYCQYNGSAREMIQLADGKILIIGNDQLFIRDFNNNAMVLTVRNKIFRINNDGSLDLSFIHPTAATADIRSMAVLPNGKIMIGGITMANLPNSYGNLFRLESNGAIDPTFNNGNLGPNQPVQSITLYNNTCCAFSTN